ncbi:hypothetical protein TRFO_29906 [Tritrichomonas foetus]|uniref:Uncharacterized protein n=1 Tax=Tritrichomonas foetus TaxID=1144522 RepID=A0A1J4K005_9EUKA|nr:hypothetical protein TRFO_29906 [Tritrichomonas foetus]|eukprot:OHT02837.1 hypothetical protein TRFO_29906 [Tritrichomonas foetus]
MFDNLIEILNSQLPLSDESSKQLNSVQQTPNLSYFGSNSTATISSQDSDEKSRLPTQELDKASLLRLLRTASLCPPSNIHYEKCKNLVSSINTSNSLTKILSQFSDFKFIVVAETLISIHTHDLAAMKEPSYATNLVKAANSSPKYIRPLFCVAILQLLGFKDIYEHKSDTIKTLPETARNVLSKKIFSPILLASFLKPDESSTVTQILKQFDVFDIILNKWIRPAKKILDQDVMKICLNEIFYFLLYFLRLFIKSLMSQSPVVIANRILPLMGEIVHHSPKTFEEFLHECNIFASKQLTDTRFSALLRFLSFSCNSKKNSLIILNQLTNCRNRNEPLIKQFFTSLKEAHDEIVSQKVSECASSALFSLKRMIKYLPEEQKSQLINMFCGSDIDPPEVSLVSFLWDFMQNSEMAPDASRTLKHLTPLYPEVVMRLFSDSSIYPQIGRMMEQSSTIASSFVKIARTLTSFSFCRLTKYREIPPFAKFLVVDYFSDSIFKKFERRSKRWSTLMLILEIALDISYCDLKFCSEIQNNQNISRSLVSIVRQTADIIETPPTIINESENVRFDSDKIRIIIQFDCTALTFMIRLLSYNLLNEKQLSYLATSFFSYNSDASSLFTTFVSFLELTHPLTSQLRYFAVQMIDIMCEIAGRMPNISVDSFYPRESQSILIESVRTNLFKSDDVTQTINELDFISHALSSQLSFAYSFVRHLGSSFVAAASKKLRQIANEFPDLLLSLSRLLSMMFQKLSHDSKAITQITTQQDFWKSIFDIIDQKPTEEDVCNLMAAKAELLNVAILDGQQIKPEFIRSLMKQVNDVLPKKFEPLLMNYKLDITRFINCKLHRTYGNDYLIDLDLLQRYLVNDNKVIDTARRLNNQFSLIDSCTQILSSIASLLHFSSDESLIPSVEEALTLIVFVLNNDIYPDSTADIAFEILDICLSNKNIPINSLKKEFLRGLTFYINKRPLESSFKIIARLLSVSDINNSEELCLMIEPCIKYALNHHDSINSILCASEIALKLSNTDNWISYVPICANCFFTLLNTPLGNYIVEFMTIICMNAANALTLEENGFFEQFVLIECNGDAKSPLWPKLFNLMTSLPLTLKVSYKFITTHFSKIVYFFDSSALENMKPIQLYKVQVAITDLLLHVAPNIQQFSEEDPTQFDMIIELISSKMKASLLFLRESPHLKLAGHLYDRDSYNEKTCNLIILRNCLLFVNKLFDFPFGKPHISSNDSHLAFPVIDLMEKMSDGLQAIISADAKEFSGICLQSFELTIRLFIGRAIATAGTEKGLKQIKDVKDSLNRSINSVQQSIRKFNIPDSQETIKFLDGLNKYLCSLIY